MSNFVIFAAAFLFWMLVAGSLMRVQLVALPVQKAPVPPFRSVPMRATALIPAGFDHRTYN